MFIALHPRDIALLRSAMFELNWGYKHFAFHIFLLHDN